MIGDVVAIHSTSWLSRLVSWVLQAEVNHIAVQVTSDRMLEMTPSGPRITPLDKYPHATRYRHPHATRDAKYAAVTWLLQRYLGSGYQYGWWQAIAIGIRQRTGLALGFRAGKICAELVAEYVQRLADLWWVDVDEVTPNGLAYLLHHEQGWTKVPEGEY